MAVVTMTAAPAFAEGKAINIEPQSLATALREFASQSQQAILVSPALADNKTSQGVHDATDPELALAQLLQGTGLTWRRSGEALLIVSASDPQSGSAAGDGAEGTVQALIVTAQKREENIQDVPIAMSAFTQEDLTRSQVTGGPDLMTQVPNFTFTKTNFTGYSIQIRGIGTQAISATTDAAVAVAENNTPFIRNRFFEQEFYDLQRVEVLRGPQGTLYGRNATAGVVNIITAKPSFHYEAKLSADVGNYNSSRFEGMVNLPLVDDKVALRLASAWTKRDGYDTNQITGNRIDGRDLWSTRLTLRFEPTDSIHANLMWEHFKEDDDRLRSGKQLCHTHEVTSVAGFPTPNHNQLLADWGQTVLFTGVQGSLSQGCAPASLYAPESFETPNGLSLPYYGALAMIAAPVTGGGLAFTDPYLSRFQSRDLRVIESTVNPQYRANSDLAELQIQYDLSDHLSLTSETGYNSDTLFSMEDYNRFNTAPGIFTQPNLFDDRRANLLQQGPVGGIFCDPQIGCADRLVAIDVSTAKSRQFSEELRLASNFEGAFNFSLGANFLRYDTEDKYYVFINTLSAYAAKSPYRAGFKRDAFGGPLPPYIPNVTDNHECLLFGYRAPDPNVAENVAGCVYMDPNPIGSLNDLGHNYFLSKNPYKLISYAVFGEAYYNITDALKLTAGLRWTVDKKEAPRIPSWVLAADSVGYPVAEVVNQEWREPTGRLTLDWKPHLSFTDETLVYASFAHGYKAGGANPPSTGVVCGSNNCNGVTQTALVGYSAAHPKTFDPEFVNAYEIGTKNTLLGGRLTLNADTFYYDYTGYQISQIVDRSAVNLNFDAKIWGAELEADWRPLENLRLGLKLGYEDTKVADGAKAIDLMDRTASDPNWLVVSPFPSFPSNCVLPTWLFVGNTTTWSSNGSNPAPVGVGGIGGGNMGGCEFAYVLGQDPATGNPYQVNPYTANPSLPGFGFRHNVDYATWSSNPADYPCWPTGVPITNGMSFPGVDPECLARLSNNGTGLYKDLSGNALPNAPHVTATLTVDYTVPLPNSWLVTLHGDFYRQSEAWARIFNTPGYDKLKAYNNVNLAAIFANEDAGWKVMAYVKNVFDRTNITGAFLNSDDTGLTTNVFLNEPRLYGLRVTKEWTGQSWWTGANPNHTGPNPLTVEVGGEVQHWDAPSEVFTPQTLANLPPTLDVTNIENRRLDWGDGHSVKLTYRPEGSPWSISGGVRYGRTNVSTRDHHETEQFPAGVCAFPASLYGGLFKKAFCDPTYLFYGHSYYNPLLVAHGQTWSQGEARDREEHTIVDFDVGRDVGLGALTASKLSTGVRYGDFNSQSRFSASGQGGWTIPEGWRSTSVPVSHNGYDAHVSADREFRGAGPALGWDADLHLLGSDQTGHVDLDWSVTGGVLFGKQKTTIAGQERSAFYSGYYFPWPIPQVGPATIIPLDQSRSKSVSVPVVDLSLGISYDIQRIKVSTGYRWERYFNVLDTGYAERKQADRTIDGPYFKIAVGFGG